MTLWRIYVEDVEGLEEILDTHAEGYTILRGVGSYKGEKEPAAVVEILGAYLNTINDLTEALRSGLNQEEVLVTSQEVHKL